MFSPYDMNTPRKTHREESEGGSKWPGRAAALAGLGVLAYGGHRVGKSLSRSASKLGKSYNDFLDNSSKATKEKILPSVERILDTAEGAASNIKNATAWSADVGRLYTATGMPVVVRKAVDATDHIRAVPAAYREARNSVEPSNSIWARGGRKLGKMWRSANDSINLAPNMPMRMSARADLESIIELSWMDDVVKKAKDAAPSIVKKYGKFQARLEGAITGKSAFPRTSRAGAKDLYRKVAGGRLPESFDITAVKGGSHFDPYGKRGLRSRPVAEIVAHEAGHARQARIIRAKAYLAAKKLGRPMREQHAIANAAPTAVFAGTNLALRIPTKTKAGAILATLPNLAVEADASRRAINALGKDAAPALGRAYATYAANAFNKVRKAGKVEMSSREELDSIIEFRAAKATIRGLKKRAAEMLETPLGKMAAEKAESYVAANTPTIKSVLGVKKKRGARKQPAQQPAQQPPVTPQQPASQPETGLGRFVPKKVRSFFTGEGATMPPAVEEGIRKVAAHPAAKAAGIDGEAIISQGRKIAQAQAAGINKKILVWSVVPPALQYGISKRDSNSSEKRIIAATRGRNFRSKLDSIINLSYDDDPERKLIDGTVKGVAAAGGVGLAGTAAYLGYQRYKPQIKAGLNSAIDPIKAGVGRVGNYASGVGSEIGAATDRFKNLRGAGKGLFDSGAKVLGGLAQKVRGLRFSATGRPIEFRMLKDPNDNRSPEEKQAAFAQMKRRHQVKAMVRHYIKTGERKTPEDFDIKFATDPRPRNDLGMFSGEEGGPNPQAIGMVYGQPQQAAPDDEQEQDAMRALYEKLKGKKNMKMSARDEVIEFGPRMDKAWRGLLDIRGTQSRKEALRQYNTAMYSTPFGVADAHNKASDLMERAEQKRRAFIKGAAAVGITGAGAVGYGMGKKKRHDGMNDMSARETLSTILFAGQWKDNVTDNSGAVAVASGAVGGLSSYVRGGVENSANWKNAGRIKGSLAGGLVAGAGGYAISKLLSTKKNSQPSIVGRIGRGHQHSLSARHALNSIISFGSDEDDGRYWGRGAAIGGSAGFVGGALSNTPLFKKAISGLPASHVDEMIGRGGASGMAVKAARAVGKGGIRGRLLGGALMLPAGIASGALYGGMFKRDRQP